MPFKYKLVTLAFVPLLFLLFFGFRTTWEKTGQAQELAAVEELAKISAGIGALVHELQKERGMSAGFIGSKGVNFGGELPVQRSEVDKRRVSFEEQLTVFRASSLGERLQRDLDGVAFQLKELPAKRQAVTAMSIGGPEAIAYYSKTISSLLTVVGHASSASSDPDVLRTAAAYNALLRGKEFAGIERATLSNVFGADKFSPEMFVRFLSISSAQETWLNVFQTYASAEQADYLTDKLKGPAVDEVARIKRAAIDKVSSESLGMDAKAWFAQSTQRIDLLKMVEEKLAADLVGMAGARLKTARLLMMLSMGLTLLAVALTSFLGYTLIRGILRQIGGEPEYAAQMARRIADGDLSQDVQTVADDQRSLMAAMHTMHNKLSHILVRIEESGKQMGQSAFQISTISKNIADTNRQEESRSAAVATATEELTAIAREVKEQAESAASKTRQVEQGAHDGVGAVERNIAELESATSEVGRASSEVSELAKAAERITRIIDTIREIAGQTNLLALNAAIEAARAGEQGRGFAVVADEVRKLAERTTASSLEVTEIVEAITRKVKQLRDAMSMVVERVHGSQAVASETAVVMNAMAGGVSEAARTNDAIAEESRRQMSHIAQLDASLSSLFATLSESAGKVEATSIIGVDLHRVSCGLNELMAGFRFNRSTLIESTVSEEQRNYPRLERGLLARVDCEDGMTQDCLTEDLSLSGARLVLNRPLPSNARLRVYLYIPYSDLEQYRRQEPVAVQAQSKWQRQEEGRLLCGVEFVNVSSSDIEHLRTVFSYYNKACEH